MEDLTLIEVAAKTPGDGRAIDYTVHALELAICSISKSPAATWDLIGKLLEALSEADTYIADETAD